MKKCEDSALVSWAHKSETDLSLQNERIESYLTDSRRPSTFHVKTWTSVLVGRGTLTSLVADRVLCDCMV